MQATYPSISLIANLQITVTASRPSPAANRVILVSIAAAARSQGAATALENAGFTNVYDVQGINQWRAAGHSLVDAVAHARMHLEHESMQPVRAAVAASAPGRLAGAAAVAAAAAATAAAIFGLHLHHRLSSHHPARRAPRRGHARLRNACGRRRAKEARRARQTGRDHAHGLGSAPSP